MKRKRKKIRRKVKNPRSLNRTVGGKVVRINGDLHARATAKAKAQEQSLSWWVEQLIYKAIDRDDKGRPVPAHDPPEPLPPEPPMHYNPPPVQDWRGRSGK